MCIRNRVISLIYKAIVVAVSLTGLLTLFGFPGMFMLGAMKYFTTLSNVLCLLFFAAAFIHTFIQLFTLGAHGTSTLLPRLKGSITIAITVTLLIYQLLLSETPFSMNGRSGDFIVHFLTPVLVILDWLLFDEKGRCTFLDPLVWTIIPLLYVAFALLAAPLGLTYYSGGRYPYFFMDIDAIGGRSVFAYIAAITVSFLVLSYLVVLLDRLLSRHRRE
ncbi:MAG: Pr6Pr family membrane protein [Oscillospiraceae bacterium]|jgi:hypothetical protein|nr:Pr6Pr family membrane protein [Oscillospiraceae bacterium]